MQRSPLESRIVTAVVEVLSTVPRSQVYKMHGGRWSHAGVPDLLFVCAALNGRAVWFEVKRPEAAVTRIQHHELDALVAAGCSAHVVRSAHDVRTILTDLGVVFGSR